MASPGVHLPAEGALPALSGATAWLNSEPLTPEGLGGKVVVADFCTCTCINQATKGSYSEPVTAVTTGTEV